MDNQLIRLELLIGQDNINKLSSSSVAIFGIGGVGSYIAESLARSGIGRLALIDNELIDITNLNRQIHALHSTVGLSKTQAMKDRIHDINPAIQVDIYDMFYDEKTKDNIDLIKFDYVADAIDSVSSKILLISLCDLLSVPIISCMGTGNKLNPTLFEVQDIYKTSGCPLARTMRKELKSRGIKSLKVVYSKEPPIPPQDQVVYERLLNESNKKQLPRSCAFVPPVAGLIISSEIIKDLIKK